MKRILILLSVIALMSSCEPRTEWDYCNCGLIISDNVYDYSVVIRNSCSGNEKRFYLAPGDWMNAYVGSDYCITNTQSW